MIVLVVFLLFIVGCSKSNEITGNVVKEVEVETVESKASCSDGDGGVDKAEKASVTGVSADGEDFEYTDRCISGLLIEYYCEDSKPVNQNLRCSNECKNGACV